VSIVVKVTAPTTTRVVTVDNGSNAVMVKTSATSIKAVAKFGTHPVVLSDLDPEPVAATADSGTSNEISRSDHVHARDAASNPMTTAGDLIKGGAAGVATRLGVGAADQILTVVAGAPAWQDPASTEVTLTGDVTGTGTGSFATTIANDAVTFAKMQNIAADKLLGRATAGSGNVEEIALTAAGRALIDDVSAAAQRTTLGLGSAAVAASTAFAAATHAPTHMSAGSDPIPLAVAQAYISITLANNIWDVLSLGATTRWTPHTAEYQLEAWIVPGDTVTIVSASADPANTGVFTVTARGTSFECDNKFGVNQTVTFGAGTSIVFSRLDTAQAEGLMSGGDKTKLDAITGTNTGNQTIALTGDVTGTGTGSFAATIANAAVTLAKMANVATARIFGRTTAGTGVPEALTGTQVTAMLDAASASLPGVMSADDKSKLDAVTVTGALTGDVTTVGVVATLATAQPGAHTWAVPQTHGAQVVAVGSASAFPPKPASVASTAHPTSIGGGIVSGFNPVIRPQAAAARRLAVTNFRGF